MTDPGNLWGQLMDALLGDCAPRRYRSKAFFKAPMPDAAWQVKPVREWGWIRADAPAGERLVVDLTAAWPSAMVSGSVALGQLEDTAKTPYAKRPGYYLLRYHPWVEPWMPHPLGIPEADAPERVWVTHRVVDLLLELKAQGRWPEVEILGSWTGERTDLELWAKYVHGLRVEALEKFGRGKGKPEDVVKDTFARIVSGWAGTPATDGTGQVQKNLRCTRADWTHAVMWQAACSAWQLADDMRRMVPEGLGPIELRATDEIVMPAEGWALVEGKERPGLKAGSGKPRKAIQVDEHGYTLGTVKIKAVESAP